MIGVGTEAIEASASVSPDETAGSHENTRVVVIQVLPPPVCRHGMHGKFAIDPLHVGDGSNIRKAGFAWCLPAGALQRYHQGAGYGIGSVIVGTGAVIDTVASTARRASLKATKLGNDARVIEKINTA